MRALCWNGVGDLRVETVRDPEIENPRDAIVRVTSSSTCGSDLPLIDGSGTPPRRGDVLGHEFMGQVVEVGPEVERIKRGDRVVVSPYISCGSCWYCRHELGSLCDNTNPESQLQEEALGYPVAGSYGLGRAFGGYAGAHAQYVRVPHADRGCFPVPENLRDERLLFLSDAVPSGFMSAELCKIEPGQTVAVWGAGAVGLMALRSLTLLGAGRVIAIDRVPERLSLASRRIGAEVVQRDEIPDVVAELRSMTGGRGPDACIDAVGAPPRRKRPLRASRGRASEHGEGSALDEAIRACRKGGTVSVVGIYDTLDDFPVGVLTDKALTLVSARQHGQPYLPRLLEYVRRGELDASFLATHRLPLESAPLGYEIFRDRLDGCVRSVFYP